MLHAGRQSMPYPAFAWEWIVVQAYPGSVVQHINVLELIACFNYFRALISRVNVKSSKYFHVVGSMVTAVVIAKGRSSSRILNRTLRRMAGLTLAGDLYPLPLWTISVWNFSDAGSRYVRPRVCPMPKPRKAVSRSVQATHLKFLGVTPATLSLCRMVLHDFPKWRQRHNLSCLFSYEVFDTLFADYTNDLHVRGDPMYKAANTFSGFTRLFPQCRR